MKTHLAISDRIKLNVNDLEELSFFLYLCIPLIVSVVNLFSSEIATSFAIVVAYFPLLLGRIIQKKRIALDFLFILLFLTLFILITYLVHPNYSEWYTRKTYGIWDYVLRPDNGIYIFLFIRVLNDPKRIIKTIRSAGWIMYVYYGYRSMLALRRGFWIDTSNKGYEIHMSYNLGLGYHILFFTLVFLYCALEYKDIKGWIGTGIGAIIIAIAGSRGPFLCILIFIALYIGVKILNKKKKAIYLIGLIAIAVAVWLALPYIFDAIVNILDTLHLPSRIVKKLVNGTISDDSRRYIIWDATVQMIKKDPLGYGALGSRHVISQYIYAGYPHNVFLEILVDFGVIIGSAIILFMIIAFFRIIFMKDNPKWKGLFIVFFANACQLLISLTYWHSIGLWSVLAVGMCIKSSCRRKELHNVEYQN